MKRIYILILSFIPLLALSQEKINQDKIQKILDKAIDEKNVFGMVVSINEGGDIFSFGAGNMNPTDQYFLASVSKLYTSAIVFQLADIDKLSLNDPINMYLSDDVMKGLHLYEDIEYSDGITIGHLISHTSGLPDYFEEKNSSGLSIREYLLTKGDTALSFDEIIQITKSLTPHFSPGQKDKAYYSDGNFQLLGKIIETITGKPLQEVYRDFIYNKLSLNSTYLYSNPNDTLPRPIYYKDRVSYIPKMMTSFKPDGGLVSSSEENLIFVKSFFEGGLFSNKNINIEGKWNKIYSPFQYGEGIMKFKFPGMPELIGHAGASGSFAYYVPSKGVYITGTINQIDKPQLAYKVIAKILATLK